ncbi:TAR DNA-binding protein 43-like isoform X2 [Uranotaenia lowii]|uniref:TAR DNA-binding protein 43-like isoform X2 n=1 Tax=Uranotaenia lowii TaxID=190385 RepID=UPI00247AEEA9|nr:TAR DNA-binding protein 43-like isoform X2 [Uranotaenia lowii]
MDGEHATDSIPGGVLVVEEEGEEAVELPLEDDGTLSLSTLQAQFYGACGLKYRNPENKAIRGVRLNDNKFHPFSPDAGWGHHIYICVFPKENKRKSDDKLENSTPKTKRIENRNRTTTDLIVLGLPWKTTEEGLREYFDAFGDLLVVQIKKDPKTGQSKGYGFIRFAKFESQMKALSKRHLIDGRWCDVKVPSSKDQMQHQMPSKIFLGRVTEDMTADDIREYFSKYGEVTDVFIPKPFRAFAFVTFIDPHVAQSLCGEDHLIKGASVYVSTASPRPEHNRNQQKNQMGGGNFSNYDERGRGGGSSGSDYGGPQSHSGMNNYHHGGGGGGYNNLPQNQPIWNYSEYSQQNRQNNSNIDSMPNLQALGLNSSGPGPNGGGQGNAGLHGGHHGSGIGGGNHLSGGGAAGGAGGGGGSGAPGVIGNHGPAGGNMNLNQMPINPAIIAAALSQWSLIGNQMHNNPQGSGGPGGPGAPGQGGNAAGPGNPAGPGSGGPGAGQEYLPWNGSGNGNAAAGGPAGRGEQNRQ